MIGAIAGDVIGSVHEGSGNQTKDFPLFIKECRFTDDTVLTVAVAERLLRGGDYVDLYHDYFQAYPQAGYGGKFIRWAGDRRRVPYNSWGNGSAMRVSPVGTACETLDEVLAQARQSAVVTHSHPEGIRGAQATAAAVFLRDQGARSGTSRTTSRTNSDTIYRNGSTTSGRVIFSMYRAKDRCRSPSSLSSSRTDSKTQFATQFRWGEMPIQWLALLAVLPKLFTEACQRRSVRGR